MLFKPDTERTALGAAMSDKNKKGPRISDMIEQDELRPLEGKLAEFRREMERIKKALEKAGPEKKPLKKTAGKSKN